MTQKSEEKESHSSLLNERKNHGRVVKQLVRQLDLDFRKV